MPANLPPQYTKAEEDYRRATSPADRLEALRELFRLLPKHKGTEKLQSDLKTKISRARDEIETSKSGGKKGGVSYRVPREGAGQVVLVGAANVGKSAILAGLTNARPEIAPYPFTTRTPQPGMVEHLDIRYQLVDLPPVTAEFFEPWMPGVIRSADAALFVVDLGDDDLIDAAEVVLSRLAAAHIELVGELPFDSEDEMTRHVRTTIIANKVDVDGARDRLAILREWYGERFPIIGASASGGGDLDSVRSEGYDMLGVIRVYTKVPGRPADRSHPFTVPIGSTVLELAREVHRDFEQSLKFAKVWGSGAFEGQTVRRDHELRDVDVVELHA
ncbi:GTPase [Tundrisphaera lichenicola]|uniref:GTPase n=1 Tax=Tundrisphaera lichenicola TaxID=2029860 RepID=UPI003EBEED39